MPVASQLAWNEAAVKATGITGGAKPPAYDRDGLALHSLSPALFHLHVQPWSADIESHVEDYNRQILSAMHADFASATSI